MEQDLQWWEEWLRELLHVIFRGLCGVAQKKDESYHRLRVANRHGSRAQSAGHSDSTTVTS